MRNLIPQRVKYIQSFANDVYRRMTALRYGIAYRNEGYDPTDADLDWMRFQLLGWQQNEDHGALTHTSIQYTTYLAVNWEDEEAMGMTPEGSGHGYLHNHHHYEPRNLGLAYNYGPGQSQNIIEVNAGGCITRINLNPAITVNHNSRYEFTQSMPQAVWTITHSMGFTPNVFTTDLNGIEMEGVVDPIDQNTIQITFSEPVSGYAYLS